MAFEGKRDGWENRRTLRRVGNRGQSLAEAALVLPMFLLLALGVVDLGRAFAFRETVTNATRDSARIATLASQETTGDAACSGISSGSASATAHIPHKSGDSPLIDLSGSGGGTSITLAAALESSATGSVASSDLTGAAVTVTWNCLSGKAVTNTTATSRDPNTGFGSATIEVHITFPFTSIVPFATSFGSPTLEADVFTRAQY